MIEINKVFKGSDGKQWSVQEIYCLVITSTETSTHVVLDNGFQRFTWTLPKLVQYLVETKQIN